MQVSCVKDQPNENRLPIQAFVTPVHPGSGRKKACVFRKLINLGHFVISPKYSGTQIIPEIPNQIDRNLKIQNTPF